MNKFAIKFTLTIPISNCVKKILGELLPHKLEEKSSFLLFLIQFQCKIYTNSLVLLTIINQTMNKKYESVNNNTP